MGRNEKTISKSGLWRFDLLMILVLLGTQNNSFHRLLEKIQKMVDIELINDKVIVQAGYTQFSSESMQIFDFIPLEKMNEL